MVLGIAVERIAEANGLTNDDVRRSLRAALQDVMQAKAAEFVGDGPAPYCYFYLADVIGNDEAGFVVYEEGGDLKRVPYTISQTGSKRTVSLAMAKSQEVWPRTVYDIAGETVMESAMRNPDSRTSFIESAELLSPIPLTEAAQADYPVCIIKPGQGASCFYPAEVLKRDGPKVFKAGLQMFYNHATAMEEAERPEGDVNKLAAVLTKDAYWDEKGPVGAALYSRMKVFADFAGQVQERAPHIGLSIKAYGEAKPVNGKLTLQNFTAAESVDFVTKAGAGGAILLEAARVAKPTQTSTKEKSTMEKDEVLALITESVKPLNTQIATLTESGKTLALENKSLKEAAVRTEARARIGEGLRKENALPAGARSRVLDVVLSQAMPLTEAGALDTAKLDTILAEAVKAEAEYLGSVLGTGAVRGMGGSAPVALTEADFAKEMTEFAKTRLGLNEADAKRYAEGRQ